jgi:hypothetical protein
MSDHLESLWDDLLSRQRQLIEAAFETLSGEEQAAVLAHLRSMVAEPDWHPEQQVSALTALEALDPDSYDKD